MVYINCIKYCTVPELIYLEHTENSNGVHKLFVYGTVPELIYFEHTEYSNGVHKRCIKLEVGMVWTDMITS